MSDYFEIGYFQLENLVINQVQFIFIDLTSTGRQVQDEPLKTLLQTVIPLSSSDLILYLKEKAEDNSAPIVLMCDDGVLSIKWATRLSEEGYINVNVIENGFAGLLEEAGSMTHA